VEGSGTSPRTWQRQLCETYLQHKKARAISIAMVDGHDRRSAGVFSSYADGAGGGRGSPLDLALALDPNSCG
jgi:hypothetical protein